jgi:hypothetical protein
MEPNPNLVDHAYGDVDRLCRMCGSEKVTMSILGADNCGCGHDRIYLCEGCIHIMIAQIKHGILCT